MAALAEKNGFGKATVTLPVEGLGHFAAALLGNADPHDLLRERRGRAGAGKDLPVLLPENVEITLTGGSPLGRVPEFVNATCPEMRRPGARETDTMDTFVDSSWYFYRYTDAHNDDAPFDQRSPTTGFPSINTLAGSSTPFFT